MNAENTPKAAPADAVGVGSSALLAAIADLDDLIKIERKRYDDETDHEWQRNQGFLLSGLRAARTLIAARQQKLLAANDKLTDGGPVSTDCK